RCLALTGLLLPPAVRPHLIVANAQWPGSRQLTVRYDSSSKPLSDPTNWPVQFSWQAPAGVWEASALTASVIQSLIASTTGFEFDPPPTGAAITSAGYVFPATSQPSPTQVTSIGNTASQWQAALYGPCTGPRISNDTTGQAIEFTADMPPLNAGEYVLLDSATQSALRNSDPNSSVLRFLNFP